MKFHKRFYWLFYLIVFLSFRALAQEKISNIKKPCRPWIMFAGIRDHGIVKKEDLLKEKELTIKYEGCDTSQRETKVGVISFELLIQINGSWVSFKSYSGTLTEDQKNALKGTQRGEFIYIEKIKVMAWKGSRDYDTLSIKVE